MAKVLNATCAAGVVKVGAMPVSTATILSQGVKPSTGVLVMDEDKQTYVTSNASDINDVIAAAANAFDKVISTLTAMEPFLVGAPPLVITASILQITLAKTSLLAIKDTLK